MEILVVGPLARQIAEMAARFPAVHVHICPKDRLPVRFAHVSRVFIATRFISHKQQTAAMRLYGRSKVSLVPGGLSSIARELERLAK